MEVRIGPHREGANGVPTARLGFENKFSRKIKYSEIRLAIWAGKYSAASENIP
jgi:hypothetical protein